MKLDKKKELASRTLGVGVSRIILNINRLDEIKEAITKQDIRDLVKNKAIKIREVKGHLTKKKRKTRRRLGSVKRKVNTRKKDYMTLARKFRAYVLDLKTKGHLNSEEYRTLRKEIRLKSFKSRTQVKERILQMRKSE